MFAQFNDFARAQIHWELGNRREANENLTAARQRAELTDSALVLHACHLVESDFAWDDDREHALACLRRGFALARARGYFNMVWMRRGTMTRVAMRALDHGVETEHVRTYVTRHGLLSEHVPARIEAWPWQYRLRAFGSFELTRERRDDLPSHTDSQRRQDGLRGMPLRLLQAILASGGRGVRENELIDALWPDADGDAGRRVFDTTLHRLRKQLGADQVVRLSDGRVLLDSRLCWVDVWALEDLVTEVQRGLGIPATVSEREDLARRLLRVYRGPLLDRDGQVSAWALGPRDRLARMFSRAAQPLGRALEKDGRFGDAIALYRRALEGDPLAESLYSGVMRCDVATGRVGEAMRTFRDYRARLAAIDGEPGPEIASMYATLTASGARGSGVTDLPG
jgi:DNA-binding SARP family transcriptional activator